MTYFQEIIKGICEKNNISFELLSKDWIIKLNKNGTNKYIVGSKMPLNSQATILLCTDKYATYEVLKSHDIPIVEHKLIYSNKMSGTYTSDLNSLKDFKDYLNKNKKVIVKNTCGSQGENVYLAKDINKLKSSLKKVFKSNNTAVVSPFMNIEAEYRIVCLEGEALLVFEKVRSENSWKHNLCQGAHAKLLNDDILKEKLSSFALNVMKALDASFASVDLILVDGEIMVLEVNSSVSLTYFASQIEGGHEMVREIYEKAIKVMFEK